MLGGHSRKISTLQEDKYPDCGDWLLQAKRLKKKEVRKAMTSRLPLSVDLCVCICLSVSVCLFLPSVSQLSVCLYVYLRLCIYMSLSPSLSFYFCVFLPICVSVCLSVPFPSPHLIILKSPTCYRCSQTILYNYMDKGPQLLYFPTCHLYL